MSRSEFRYNRKRKHYSYLFKDVGSKRKNIILSSKPVRKEHKKIKRNVKLYKNPNPNMNSDSYVIREPTRQLNNQASGLYIGE